MNINLKKLYFLLFLIISMVACDNKEATAQLASNSINISKEYIRAMPPGQKITALFMQLENTSSNKYSLLKAESNVSEHVELHQHIQENGMMRMGQVDQIAIPANGSIALETGGYHIMLIGLKQELPVGQKVNVNLVFNDSSVIAIQPVVKKD